MAETIQLRVDDETARAFSVASAEERQKLSVLLSVWLKQCETAAPFATRKTATLAEEKQARRGDQEYDQ